MTEKELFEKCNKVVAKNEGGYVNDPDDPGGETYAGISRKNYPDWEGWILVDKTKELKGLKRGDFIEGTYMQKLVDDFYYQRFWKPCNLFGIENHEIVLQIYDFAVNAGKSKAIKIAQKLAGVYEDGNCGFQTITAINNIGSYYLQAYKNRRGDYYRTLKTFDKFGKGWLNRIENTHF